MLSQHRFDPSEFECDDIEFSPNLSPTLRPTFSPTFDDDDAVEPECTDTPNWVDSYGDRCAWYEFYDFEGCLIYGADGGPMGTAHDNCCHCGGGFIFGTSGVDNPTSSPSPTAKPTIYAVSNDDPDHQFGACDDTIDWEDSFGNGCIW